RGPSHNGQAPAEPLQFDWPSDGLPVLWRAEVGTGFSSLAIADGRLFTIGNTADIDTISALHADSGELLWQVSYPAALDPNLFEGGPTSTPTVADGAVYSFSRQGLVLCLDAATGAERWRVDLVDACGVNIPSWGFSGSPVVDEDRLLLNAGSAGVALDRQTGAVLWKSDNTDDAGYATPLLATFHDCRTLLLMSGKALHAVDPATGQRLWEHRWITRYGVNAADPLIHGNQLFLSSGYAKGSSLLEVTPDGVKELWRNRDLRNQMSPGVLIDGQVYAIDGDAGEDCKLKCLDMATGAVRWEQAGLGSASLIACGSQLILLGGEGELVLAVASPESFQPQTRASVLSGKCWTAPALAAGRLYCRSVAGTVVCLDLRPRP
ncbi:MAG: PQQ-binding-like beta-propeller repeat protein, partial [Planctomycetaceae bacterium]